MKTEITTVPKPNCPVCKNTGQVIYNDLTDSLSSTKGTWSMKKCSNNKCKTIWLDPTPDLESIPLLYEKYTTHHDPQPLPKVNRTGIKKLFDEMRTSVLNKKLKYPCDLSPLKIHFLNTISLLHLGWRDEQLNQVLYIPYVKNGHLLDVGCGGGLAMMTMQNRGWKVTGTDFDKNAIENAQKKGLEVYLGDLEEIKFPDNSFDAILLSHVIEHVPDPVNLLRECRRILKPNGHLIALTPNANSQGHRYFKHHWRGLEIPRHLQVFTPNSLQDAGLQAGFKKSEGRTCLQGVYYIWDASLAHKKTGSYDLPPLTTNKKITNKLKLFWAGIKKALKPGQEETAILYCQK